MSRGNALSPLADEKLYDAREDCIVVLILTKRLFFPPGWVFFFSINYRCVARLSDETVVKMKESTGVLLERKKSK